MYIQFEKFTGNNKMYKILIKSPRIRGLGLTLLVYLTRYYKKKKNLMKITHECFVNVSKSEQKRYFKDHDILSRAV